MKPIEARRQKKLLGMWEGIQTLRKEPRQREYPPSEQQHSQAFNPTKWGNILLEKIIMKKK